MFDGNIPKRFPYVLLCVYNMQACVRHQIMELCVYTCVGVSVEQNHCVSNGSLSLSTDRGFCFVFVCLVLSPYSELRLVIYMIKYSTWSLCHKAHTRKTRNKLRTKRKKEKNKSKQTKNRNRKNTKKQKNPQNPPNKNCSTVLLQL